MVMRLSDGAIIPLDASNPDYAAIQAQIQATPPAAALPTVNTQGAGSGTKYISLNQYGSVIATVIGTARYYPSATRTISAIYAYAGSPSNNADFKFDILKNGTSLNISNLTIPQGAYAMNAVNTSFQITPTDYLTVNILQGTVGDFRLEMAYT